MANKKNVKFNGNKNKLAAKSTGWSIGSCEKACYYLLHLLFFLLPLTIFPFTYDNFDLPKLVLLRTLVFVAFGLWVACQVFSRKVVIRRTSLDIFVLLFVVATLIAAIAGIDPFIGLWGKYERYEGFFTIFSYAVLFFLAVQTFHDTRRARALTDTIMAATALASIYGLFQYLGFDLFSWGQQNFEASRVASTFGNPILFAGYLVLVLPVAIVRLREAENDYWAVFCGLTVVVSLAALLVTFSRGGWVAVLVASAVLLIGQGKSFVNMRLRILGAFLMAVILMAVLVGTVFSGSLGTSLIGRIESVSRVGEGSIATRLLIWSSALKVVKDRPLLGWGPDTFHLTYPPHGTQRYAELVERWNQPDNAHNYLLQIASTGGLLSLWVFISLLVFVIWQGAAIVRKKGQGEGVLSAGLLAGILAYIVHLQFSINVIDSGAVFWLFLGLLYAPHAREVDVNKTVLAAALPSLAAIGFALTMSLRFLAADANFLRAEQSASSGSLDSAVREYNRAIALNPDQNLYLISLANLYAEVASRERNPDWFAKAESICRDAQKKNPRELDNYVFLGNLFLRQAAFDSRYYALAEAELERALNMYPFWADTHILLGRLYFETGELAGSERHFRKAAEIDSRDAQAHLYLARIYKKTGRLDDAYSSYQEVLERDAANSEAKKAIEDLARVAGAVTQGP